jgi:hypothetical protein
MEDRAVPAMPGNTRGFAQTAGNPDALVAGAESRIGWRQHIPLRPGLAVPALQPRITPRRACSLSRSLGGITKMHIRMKTAYFVGRG